MTRPALRAKVHAQDGTLQVEFATFIDSTATDLSILGRDVLNHFDLILSRRRNEVLLLASNHQYRYKWI